MLIGCYQGTKQQCYVIKEQLAVIKEQNNRDVNELLSRNKTIEMLIGCYQGTKQQMLC